jgi:hypothetical protein
MEHRTGIRRVENGPNPLTSRKLVEVYQRVPAGHNGNVARLHTLVSAQ